MKERLSVADRDPESEAEEAFAQKELLSAVSSLPPQQKEVIMLKFIVGLDNQQVSLIMGKSQGAIRIIQMRALDALHQKLSGAINI